MARTAANTSLNDLMGGGIIPVNTLPMAARSKIMDQIKKGQKDTSANIDRMASHLEEANKHHKILPKLLAKHQSLLGVANTNRKDTLVEFFKQRDLNSKKAHSDSGIQKKQSKDLVDTVIKLHKFETHETKHFYKEMIEYQKYNSSFLRLLSGRDGMIDRVFEGVLHMSKGAVTSLVGGSMKGLGKIFSAAIQSGPIKAAAEATKSFFGIFKIVPRLLAGTAVGSSMGAVGLFRAAKSLRALAAGVLLAGTAYKFFTDKDSGAVEAALNIVGRKATTMEQIAAGLGSFLNDLTLGLSDYIAKEFTGKTGSQLIDKTFKAVEAESDKFMLDPVNYVKDLPKRLWGAVLEGFAIVSSTSTYKALSTYVSDQIDLFMANPREYMQPAITFVTGALMAMFDWAVKPFKAMGLSKSDTIVDIKDASDWLATNSSLLVGKLYDRVASLIKGLFDKKSPEDQSVIGALFAGAGAILMAVGSTLLTKIGVTLSSKEFWAPIGSLAGQLAIYAGKVLLSVSTAILIASEVALKNLLSVSLISSIVTGSSLEKTVIGVTKTLTFFVEGAVNIGKKIQYVFGGAVKILETMQIGLASFAGQFEFLKEVDSLARIIKAGEDTKGIFGPFVRIVSSIRGFFTVFEGVGSLITTVGEPLVRAAKFIGPAIAKFAWPLQIVLSVFDFISGFNNAADTLGITPDKLTLMDKIKGGIGAIVSGILDMPVHAISWVATWVWQNVFGGNGSVKVDNLGQAFGYSNTTKMIADLMDNQGTGLATAGKGIMDMIGGMVRAPWSMIKWVIKKATHVFGWDFFADDPDASLEAAAGHYQDEASGALEVGKGFVQILLGVPYKIGNWIFNKLAEALGFDMRIPGSIDEILAKVTLPNIGDILKDTATSIISWFTDLFNIDTIKRKINNAIAAMPGAGILGFEKIGDNAFNTPSMYQKPTALSTADDISGPNSMFSTPPALLPGPSNISFGPNLPSMAASKDQTRMGNQGNQTLGFGNSADGLDTKEGYAAYIAAQTANPAVTSAGRVDRYADGGVIVRPITFNNGGGRTGIAGEEGPEAIMPLSKMPNGALGITAKLELDEKLFSKFGDAIELFTKAIYDNAGAPIGAGGVSGGFNFSHAASGGSNIFSQAANGITSGIDMIGNTASNIYNHAAPSVANAVSSGASAVGSAVTSLSGKAKSAYNYFISLGWSAAQSAGLVSNIQHESSFNENLPGDKNKYGVYEAYGLAQWHADRRANFTSIYHKDMKDSSFKEQLDFIDWELRHTESEAGRALSRATTPAEAGSIVSLQYERPGDKQGQANARANTANGIFSQFGAGDISNAAYAVSNVVSGAVTGAGNHPMTSVSNLLGAAATSIGDGASSMYNQAISSYNTMMGVGGSISNTLGIGGGELQSPQAQANRVLFQQQSMDDFNKYNVNLANNGFMQLTPEQYGISIPKTDDVMNGPRESMPSSSSSSSVPNVPRPTTIPNVKQQARNETPANSPMNNIPLILSDLGLALVGLEDFA